jgi:predicted enzyme related to lactoylglutathione lyase
MVRVKLLLSESNLVTLVPIRDMERAVKFYTEALGGKLTRRGEGDMKDSWASIKLGKSELWLIVPETREKRALAYTAFVVKDVKSVVADLKNKGVRFNRAVRETKETKIDGPIAYDEWGAAAFFKDSEGNLLMVWQNP